MNEMLETLSERTVSENIHRLANQSRMLEFLREQGFDAESVKEQLDLLKEFGVRHDIEDLLDGPFRQKHTLDAARIDPTRYSDGTLPVFYGALEAKTAQTEVMYHYGRLALGDPAKRRTVYYMHFRCRFGGRSKDLRGKQKDWPLLVETDISMAYPFCNRLGAEAVSEGLDGLYAPSARRAGGTCTPIFQRRALSDPKEEALCALSYRSDSSEIEVRTAPLR